jgi:hypothetical protein
MCVRAAQMQAIFFKTLQKKNGCFAPQVWLKEVLSECSDGMQF